MSTSEEDQEFAAFFRSHDRRLRGYLRSRGAPPDLIDEIAPFAFMALRRHWERLRSENPRAYLFTIGNNELKRQIGPYKKKLEAIQRVSLDALLGQSAEQEESRIDPSSLEELIQRLPASQRNAIVYRHIEGRDVKESANIMGVSEGSVKRYTFEGLKALGIEIERHESMTRQNESGKVKD